MAGHGENRVFGNGGFIGETEGMTDRWLVDDPAEDAEGVEEEEGPCKDEEDKGGEELGGLADAPAAEQGGEEEGPEEEGGDEEDGGDGEPAGEGFGIRVVVAGEVAEIEGGGDCVGVDAQEQCDGGACGGDEEDDGDSGGGVALGGGGVCEGGGHGGGIVTRLAGEFGGDFRWNPSLWSAGK